MQQKLAQKEKAAKEENLRLLAQRAREERSGILPPSALAGAAAGTAKAAPVAKGMNLGGYGSGSDTDSASESDEEKSDDESDEDTEEAREREKIRREKRQEREREMRLNNMGSEQRAKMLMKWVVVVFDAHALCADAALTPPESKTAIFRKRLRSVWPSRPRPRRRSSTRGSSTARRTLAPRPSRTATTSTTSRSSTDRRLPRPSTSRAATMPTTMRLPAGPRRASRLRSRTIALRWACAGSRAQATSRSRRARCSSRRTSALRWIKSRIRSA